MTKTISLPKPTLTTSIVNSSRRLNRWGSNKYRGNCDGRIFADLVLRYGATSVADPMIGSGTTRDCIAELNRKGANITYWGGDLNQGFNLLEDDIQGKHDFIWIHPPYWNLIRYSQREGDLSNIPTYAEFLAKLETCLTKCYEALNPNGRLAVMVGDLHRNGKYIPICRDVQNLDGKIGQLRTVIVNQQNNCWSDIVPMKRRTLPLDGILVRHDCCMVFKNQEVRMIDFQNPQTWIVAWCEHNSQNKFRVFDNYQAAWSRYKKLLPKDNLHSASLAVIVESTDY